MRAMLAKADLARYAGQFVWLELSYDNERNRAFLTKYGAHATPTFFIVDSRDQRVAATQTGAMSFTELTQFLNRGESVALARRQTHADAALTRGDALLSKQPSEAAKAYNEAIHLAPPNWPQRELVEASFVGALENSKQFQECAETAATDAVHMKQDSMFARTVVAGMWCLDSGDPAPWSTDEARRLEPLAEKALALPGTVRDERDALYRTLMYLSFARNDSAEASKWGDRWLKELDAVKPVDDDERTAVDIARVENVQVYGDPARILPDLLKSEREMPKNYNASLRVAQMEEAVQHYDEAIAACNRGLTRSPGALGRSWLLQVKADALVQLGKPVEARLVLEEGLQAAQAIPQKSSRENNIAAIKNTLLKLGGASTKH